MFECYITFPMELSALQNLTTPLPNVGTSSISLALLPKLEGGSSSEP